MEDEVEEEDEEEEEELLMSFIKIKILNISPSWVIYWC